MKNREEMDKEINEYLDKLVSEYVKEMKNQGKEIGKYIDGIEGAPNDNE